MRRVPCILTSIIVLAVASTAFCGCGAKDKEGPETIAEQKAEAPLEKVDVEDIEVAYRVYGEGETLIVIMGFSGTMDIWSPDLIDNLARSYRVIVFDNRGMGETTAGTEEFTIERFAADTAGFMDALGIDGSHVLGWSMGTEIAQELTLDYPDKVNGLILYAADPGGEQAVQPSSDVLKELEDTSGTVRERGERLLKLLVPMDWLAEHGEELEEIFSGSTEQASPQNVARQAEAMEKWRGSYDRLPEIESDTMLLTGTDDILTPPENSLIMVDRIPGAWLVQLQGGGHGVMFQYPEQMARIITVFLSSP
ncbi:MAG: alpha/beta hydrolase [Actinomycetota bacterium]|nr:alpha/beta hydrolase [Actinomycetota bacterium]